MINELSAWLANPNRSYADGVAIYNSCKRTNKFDNYFASVQDPPKSSLQFRMLFDQLTRISRILKAKPELVVPQPQTTKPIVVKAINTESVKKNKPAAAKNTEPKRPVIVENALVDVKALPAELKVKYFENKEIIKLINQKHEALKKMDKDPKFDKDRKRIAGELAELDDKRAAAWKEIDEWWNENKDKKAADKPKEDTPELQAKVDRINNLKNYINRTKAQTKKHPEHKSRNEAKIKKWEKELDELTGKHTD